MNLLWSLALFLVFLTPSGNLPAETDRTIPISEAIQVWDARLEESAKKLQAPDLADEAVTGLRAELTEIRDQARTERDEIESEVAPVQDELDALGPPPAENEAKENPAIARKRRALTERLSAVEGRIKEVDLVVARTEKLLGQISALRIDRFTASIFSRGISPLSPAVWRKSVSELRDKSAALASFLEQWTAKESFAREYRRWILHLAFALGGTIAVLWPFSRWFSRRFGRIPEVETPSYPELLRAALAFAFVRILVPGALLTITFQVLVYDLGGSRVARELGSSILLALIMIICVTALSRATLAPFRSRWRLMPLDDNNARYIHKIIVGLAWVFGIDQVLDSWFTAGRATLELAVLWKFLGGLLIAGLLLALLVRRRLWRPDIEHPGRKVEKPRLWFGIRGLIGVLVLTIPVSAIAGYVAFSRVLGTQIVLTGALYILVVIISALCTELLEELFSPTTVAGEKIRRNLELSSEGADLLVFWLKALVHFIIYIGAVLVFLVIWGAGGEDINEWLYKAFFGFNLAGVTVSIAGILFAIALFAGILLLTRLFQRFLERRVLPRTRFDFGIQHSIRAAVGYIGFIIAAVFAVSSLGIDLTKLAFIAGALTVGIGFGLQNVVNNFVSGLILLIERPIKVGDWVVVGEKQGYVKRIKVRATEVQTFDRASVFIPNSDLISNPLLNWTHADKTGRVIVPVGVAYGSDTEKVRDLLLEAAKAHPAVSASPAPSVLFKGFGDSCLDFELRAFIQDVDKVVAVSSDLCFAIDKAFRRENIEIPFPQQDVHWKDFERLETLLSRLLAEKKP